MKNYALHLLITIVISFLIGYVCALYDATHSEGYLDSEHSQFILQINNHDYIWNVLDNSSSL